MWLMNISMVFSVVWANIRETLNLGFKDIFWRKVVGRSKDVFQYTILPTNPRD